MGSRGQPQTSISAQIGCSKSFPTVNHWRGPGIPFASIHSTLRNIFHWGVGVIGALMLVSTLAPPAYVALHGGPAVKSNIPSWAAGQLPFQC